MKRKFAMFCLCVMTSMFFVACSSSKVTTPTNEPTNKVESESSSVEATQVPSEEVTQVPSEVPSEEVTQVPSEAPSEETTQNPSEEEKPTHSVVPDDSSENEDEEKEPTLTSSVTPTLAPTNTPTPIPTNTPTPTPSVTPTPSPTPSVTPTPTTKPSGDSNWSGGYDNLPSEGFDHIKVPTKSDFYDEGFDDKLGAFDFDGSDWSNEWWDAYQDFLVANGSPIDSDGNPMGAWNAIHDGSVNGYQYLYYGVNWSGSRDGWGDIVLLPRGLNSTMVNNPNYDGAYVLELTNFTYGNMDKGVENEYRSATTMMLSWICPNPSQVEKAIYDGFVDDNSAIWKHYEANGCGSWMQVGEVDIALVVLHGSTQEYMFAIRAHK